MSSQESSSATGTIGHMMDDEGYRERRYRRKRKSVARKVIMTVLAALICLPLFLLALWAGSKVFFPVASEVTGIDSEITASAKKGISRKVHITNPNDRKLELQSFEDETNSWVTKKEIETGAEEEVDVKVKFPKAWTKKTYSKWRLYMEGGFGTKKYVGDEIDVVCTNRGNINVKVSAACVYCVDNDKVIYNINMNKKLPNASTTKMITAILALENSADSDVVTISRRAAITPWAVFAFRKGDKFYMGDLLRAMLVVSSNNSATAIGEYVGGSYEGFQDMMNKRAKELGCKNTHFVTPSGLDANGHHSTAYDLALINKKAIEFEEYNKIMLKKSVKFKSINNNERPFKSKGTNEKLLSENIKGYMGGKTGTTAQAGYCLSSAYKWNGKTYIIVVLNAASRDNATRLLMEYVRKYGE